MSALMEKLYQFVTGKPSNRRMAELIALYDNPHAFVVVRDELGPHVFRVESLSEEPAGEIRLIKPVEAFTFFDFHRVPDLRRVPVGILEEYTVSVHFRHVDDSTYRSTPTARVRLGDAQRYVEWHDRYLEMKPSLFGNRRLAAMNRHKYLLESTDRLDLPFVVKIAEKGMWP